jgi:hypothetical protein
MDYAPLDYIVNTFYHVSYVNLNCEAGSEESQYAWLEPEKLSSLGNFARLHISLFTDFRPQMSRSIWTFIIIIIIIIKKTPSVRERTIPTERPIIIIIITIRPWSLVLV